MKLTLNYIRQLASGNEGVDVEFKETTGQLNRGMETLCGMVNGNGGIVVFGVSNNGKIKGQDIADKTTREIGEALSKFDPAVDIQPVYLRIENSDKHIIVFYSDGLETDKPYLWDGKPYQRYDSVTSVMPREKFIKLHERQHGLKYKWENEINLNLTIDSLDEQLILNTVESAVRRGRLTSIALNDNAPTALKRFKLIKDGNICNSAAVLFGKDFIDYPQCKLRLARFRGNNKQYFIDNQQHEGNVFQLVDMAMTFFFKHLNLSGTTHLRIVREDELEIPYDALREGVVNAYCHMNWGYEIASVGIAIYDERIEIENAGRFPARISPNILIKEEECSQQNTSLPPNPVIANVMYLAGLIEHWGRGLSMMAKECERVGLPSPKFYSDGSIVKITFTRSNNTLRSSSGVSKDTSGVSRSKIGVSNTKNEPTQLSPRLLSVIKALGEDWFSSYELCDILGYKSRNSFVRRYIKPAIGNNLIAFQNPDNPNAPNQRYGLTVKGKAVYYSIKNTTIQTNITSKNDSQSIGFDPQEEAIISAIKNNSSISRAELAEIASCSESTIRRRLRVLNIAWLGHPRTGHWVFIKDIQ